jgi:hypothetical protein
MDFDVRPGPVHRVCLLLPSGFRKAQRATDTDDQWLVRENTVTQTQARLKRTLTATPATPSLWDVPLARSLWTNEIPPRDTQAISPREAR